MLIVLEERNSKDRAELSKVLDLGDHEGFETQQTFTGSRLPSSTLDFIKINKVNTLLAPYKLAEQ